MRRVNVFFLVEHPPRKSSAVAQHNMKRVFFRTGLSFSYNNSVLPRLFHLVVPFAGHDEELVIGGVGEGRLELHGNTVGGLFELAD